MTERNTAVPAAYIIFEKDGKIAMLRRFNTGWSDGMYQMPSGHIEEGELPAEAALREAKEEVGVTIAHDDLELVHTLYRISGDLNRNRADYFFKAHNWEGEIENCEPGKCDEILWVSVDELPENTVEHIKTILKAIKRGEIHTEIRG